METTSKDRDIVINPNEFVFVQDRTKGIISVAVGPAKQSLSDTEQLVRFDEKDKRFTIEMNGKSAKQTFPTAPEGWYIILKNPALDGKHPTQAKASSPPENHLQIGKKINLPGPQHIPLWPGQMAKVVRGHHLRSNQYLLLRVYDDAAARENIGKAVVKHTELTDEQKKALTADQLAVAERKQTEPAQEQMIDPKLLVTGSLHILKGNEISFYIPPTGIEVVPYINQQNKEEFVRNAVTLERLEYCILLNENGEKRYMRGPDVVFPMPTETFKAKDGKDKFRAYELTPTSGLYIKVIDSYKEGDKSYDVGEELFITGTRSQIYFPREEHAIIRYGNSDVHHAIALPSGEGRYVLNRIKGTVDIVKGPKMFLPDPRQEVVVRRILEDWECQLFYPGNDQALAHNAGLRTERDSGAGTAALDELQAAYSNTFMRGSTGSKGYAAAPVAVAAAFGGGEELYTASVHLDSPGDSIRRKKLYTPPRTITLDNKYEGPVIINIWTGYAVQVVSKGGTRKVVEGPVSYMLEYDETLEKLSFSKGLPKKSFDRIDSVYLRTKNNHVADIIEVETKDLVPMQLKLSFHVNFEGDSSKWFEVENYVKLLVDRARSLLRNQAKKYSVHQYNEEAIDLIRGVVLSDGNARFNENNMVINDVEVLSIRVARDEIQDLLMKSQMTNVQKAIEIKIAESLHGANKLIQGFERLNITENQLTAEKRHSIAIENEEMRFALEKEKTTHAVSIEVERVKGDGEVADNSIDVVQKIVKRKEIEQSNEIEHRKSIQQLEIEHIVAETEAAIKKIAAIQPGTVEALTASSQLKLLTEALPSLAPLALVEQQSISGLLHRYIKGTPLENALATILPGMDKGNSKQ